MHHGTASAISGASAGLAASIVTCPLDVVKTRLQAQIGPLPNRSSNQQQQAIRPTADGVTLPQKAARDAVLAQERNAGLRAGAREGVSAVVSRGPAVIKAAEGQYQSIPEIMRRIWIEDGFKGFYRGLGPTIFGYLPTWAIYFSVYDTCKDTLATTLHLNAGHTEFINHIVAAMAAGAASTVCTSPLWVVKTRFMLQTGSDPNVKKYRHTGDAFVQIWQAEGWRGFYKGLLPSLFGVSHVAVQFPLYEQFKAWARASRRRTLERERATEGWRASVTDAVYGSGASAASKVSAQEEAALPSSTILVCSSTAKMIASVATYPHEVLRTKLQMQPKGGPAVNSVAALHAPMAAGRAAGEAGAGSAPGAGTTRSFHTFRNGIPWQELPPAASVRRRTRHGPTQTTSTLPPSSTASLSYSAPSAAAGGPPHSNSSASGSTPLTSRAAHAISGLTDASVHLAEGQGQGRGRYTGVIQACRTIAREEGIRGFYRGMTVNLVRTVPNSALTILTYELMMRQLTGSNV